MVKTLNARSPAQAYTRAAVPICPEGKVALSLNRSPRDHSPTKILRTKLFLLLDQLPRPHRFILTY